MIFQIVLDDLTGTEENYEEELFVDELGRLCKRRFYLTQVLDTESDSIKENKRQLIEWFRALGVPKGQVRRHIKNCGFWWNCGTKK